MSVRNNKDTGMRIVKHDPPKPVAPPCTYDLIGLSQAEVDALFVLIASTSLDNLQTSMSGCRVKSSAMDMNDVAFELYSKMATMVERW